MAGPKTKAIPLGFGDVTVTVNDHIAHFYRGETQMFDVLGPYIAEGLRRGERCAVVSSPASAQGLKRRLSEMGLDPGAAEADGRLAFAEGEASAADMRALFERF